MKKMLAALLLSACLVSCALGEDYINPILVKNDQGQVMDAADPFILRFNGKYYLYPTGGAEIRVYESSDLLHWEYKGECTQGRKVYIGFAPEVFYWRGDFYMITSPLGNGHYILKSDSPLGPFEPVTGNFGYSIDGSLFALDNGELWMFCLNGNTIKQTKINEKTFTPEGVMFSTSANLRGWTEGPGLIRRGEWNYLTLCGNHYLSTGYRVISAARKGDPVGVYMQSETPLLIHSEIGARLGGLGHSSNFYGPDLESMYTSYHCHASYGNGTTRYLCLDRLLTNGGVLYTTGPSEMNMPAPAFADVQGDVQGDRGGFTEGENGFFAAVAPSFSFTQECNFLLRGGKAVWQMGSKNGQSARIETDGETLSLCVGDTVTESAALPPLGRQGRLHTLRVEANSEVLYVSVDTQRVLTVPAPGICADVVGAVRTEGADYSFIAHTGRALGEGDATALKALPGRFAAVHALPDEAPDTMLVGAFEEKAAVLGKASYCVRVQQAGNYRFDFTVHTQDAGKTFVLSAGNEQVSVTVPDYQGKKKADWFTFTTPMLPLQQGDQTLSIEGDGVRVTMIEGYVSEEMPARSWDFAADAAAGVYLLGGATVKDGLLSLPADKPGFAVIGSEGCTDYEMQVTFQIPKKGLGSSGFMVRATEVSFSKEAVMDSFYGYAIGVSPIGLNVRRIRYGAVGNAEFCSIKDWGGKSEAELVLRVQGNRLSVFLPGSEKPLLTLEDADAFTHGLCGLFSTGKELNVTRLTLRPLEE